jgi:hypothetical protein
MLWQVMAKAVRSQELTAPKTQARGDVAMQKGECARMAVGFSGTIDAVHRTPRNSSSARKKMA